METWFAPASGLDVALQKAGGIPFVPFSTPVSAGASSAASGVSNTQAFNTTVTTPIGGLLRVMAWNGGSNMPVSCTDSLGNTYAVGWSFNNGTYQGKEFYIIASAEIPSGTTVTVTHHASSTNGFKTNTAVMVAEGVVALDHAGTGATLNPTPGTVASKTTNTFAQANTIIFADDLWSGGNADTFTFGGGFALLTQVTSGVRIAHTSYKIVAATTAETITVTDTVGPYIWSLGYSAFKGN